jgi:phospholipase D1/2
MHQRAKPSLSGIADRVSFLINGKQYFSCLARALNEARRRIWIIGWNFNPEILLEPEQSGTTLGDILERAVQSNPDLEVRILVWTLGPIYSDKSPKIFLRKTFPKSNRIQLRFAFQPVLRACHHQKLVCIDDAVAFLGGIDLASRRWDTRGHRIDDERRRDSRGLPYEPVHDLQVMVSGEAARSISHIVRERWAEATGEWHGPLAWAHDSGLHYDGALSLSHMRFRIAVSGPRKGSQTDDTPGSALTKWVIAAAKRHLYIETQYLASFNVAEALAARLREKEGPEIVIVCPRASHGLIEKLIMDANRGRIIAKLKQADKFDRLRVFYPVIPDGRRQVPLFIHSKLLIADDSLVRIGSSNLNHRSESLDTECDILFEAQHTEHRRGIRSLRHALLSEFLGCSSETVDQLFEQESSLIRAIAAVDRNERGLRPLLTKSPRTTPVWATALFDPAGPSPSRLCRVAGRLRRMFRFG